MVGVAEHLLEQQPRVFQPLRIGVAARVSASTSQKEHMLNVPSWPVRPSGAAVGIVAIDESVGGQAPCGARAGGLRLPC